MKELSIEQIRKGVGTFLHIVEVSTYPEVVVRHRSECRLQFEKVRSITNYCIEDPGGDTIDFGIDDLVPVEIEACECVCDPEMDTALDTRDPNEIPF